MSPHRFANTFPSFYVYTKLLVVCVPTIELRIEANPNPVFNPILTTLHLLTKRLEFFNRIKMSLWNVFMQNFSTLVHPRYTWDSIWYTFSYKLNINYAIVHSPVHNLFKDKFCTIHSFSIWHLEQLPALHFLCCEVNRWNALWSISTLIPFSYQSDGIKTVWVSFKLMNFHTLEHLCLKILIIYLGIV